MKKYVAPELNICLINTCDIITASFGSLKPLPDGDDTPLQDAGDSLVDW